MNTRTSFDTAFLISDVCYYFDSDVMDMTVEMVAVSIDRKIYVLPNIEYIKNGNVIPSLRYNADKMLDKVMAATDVDLSYWIEYYME